MKFTIAIDGPAAAGKGTVAKALAQHFGFAHLDTGLLYRAVARRVLNGEDAIDAARALVPADTDRTDLRTAKVAQEASHVAAIPEVRAALVDYQRVFSRQDGGAVVDGRDIGTVVCPEAEAKLFITASDAVRADRRFQELRAKGTDTTLETVLAELQARDTRDRAREASPLVAAPDAVQLDTSDLSIDQAVAQAIAFVQGRLDAFWS